MPPPVKSAYAGGFSDNIKRQLEQTTIPDKVKCVTCKKIRMQSMFSKRQLEYLRHGMVTQGARAINGSGIAKCRVCVGGQTVELKCCVCDKIKGLDDFAKSQRQHHELARCLNCIQNVTETELVDEQKLLPESDLTTQDSALTMSHFDEESLVETTQRLNLKNPYGFPDFEEEEDKSFGGGVWVETGRGNEENGTSKGKGRIYTGFDSNGNAHRCLIDSYPSSDNPESLRASGRGYNNGAAVDLPQINTGLTLPPPPFTKKRASKFAKVPGRRIEKADAPSMRVPESAGEPVPSDDEDEDRGVEEFL